MNPGRPRGSTGTCSSCGKKGHNGTPSGCSPSHVAAVRVIAGDMTLTQASERFGISRQSIHERIRRFGLHIPRSR